MAKFNLFKTSAEKRAYVIGRKHQYNKEHPLMKYKVSVDSVYMNNDNRVEHRMKDVEIYSSYHKTKKSAQTALNKAIKREKYQKESVLRKAKAGTLNMFNSQDHSYYDFKIVKCNKRM
ncbi:MAG: hypothetical protein IKC71_05230 [Clostridia bacterium]|nr:hypothetical protein [Clostridia bacterium]